MSDDSARPDTPKVHYEGGIPVLPSATDTENAKQEAKERDERAYKERQLALDGRMVWFTAALVFCTVITAGINGLQTFVANKGAQAARDAVKAANQSTYMACLSAQATQATFFQVQNSASDTHAATAASVEQAIAGIESERSLITFNPRIPNQSEFFNGVLGIPFGIKNEGKSVAVDFTFRAKAVWLKDTDKIPISNRVEKVISAKYIPSGSEFPEKPNDSIHKSMTYTLPVKDLQGNKVPAPSEIANDFINGNGGMVAIFGNMKYRDFAGLHEAKFCQTMGVVKSGYSRQQSREEIPCANYNQRIDKYTRIPSLISPAQIEIAPIKSITCVKPSE